jgi:hypothetical protein
MKLISEIGKGVEIVGTLFYVEIRIFEEPFDGQNYGYFLVGSVYGLAKYK